MNSIDAFIKILSTMALSLTGADVSAFDPDVRQWEVEAKSFCRKHDFASDFSEEVKLFLKKKMEFDTSDGEAVSALIKSVLPSIQEDLDVSREKLGLIKDCALFFRKDSTPAWSRISTNVSTLRDPKLARAFLDPDGPDAAEPISDKSTAHKMARIVEELTGRRHDSILTLTEIAEFRKTDEDLIAKYSVYRKEFISRFRDALRYYVRMSGKHVTPGGPPLVDVKAASKILHEKGCDYLPRGFVGKVDEKGVLHTITGKPLTGYLVGEVVMNPSYDPKTDSTYVCSLKDNKNNQLRTQAFVAANKAARFEKIRKFSKEVDKHRKNWVKDLSSPDPLTQIMATITEAIYETQARIGGDSTNKEDEDRYGMSTITVDHVKVQASGLHIKYVGKKGTVQEHFIKNTDPVGKKVCRNMQALMKGKKAGDPVFTYNGKQINGQGVNKYLKQIGIPSGITIHKFRHVYGTQLALKIIEDCPLEKGISQSAAEKWLKEALIPVGEALKHRTGTGDKQKVTSMTAIQSYISPELLKTWFTGLNLRTPQWVPKI